MDLPLDSWILIKLSKLFTPSQHSDGVVLQLITLQITHGINDPDTDLQLFYVGMYESPFL